MKFLFKTFGEIGPAVKTDFKRHLSYGPEITL